MTSLSELIAPRIVCCKNFSNPSKTSGITGICFKCFLCSLVLKSALEAKQGGMAQGNEVTSVCVMTLSVRNEMQLLSPVVVPFCGCGSLCKVSRLLSAALLCGGTLWQEVHLIQAPLLICVGYWLMAFCLLNIKQQVPAAPKKVSIGLCMKRRLLRKW
uniref:Uncharacterized protein n=1 Tax=Rhipicephalus zambeziensis TaxID=60191 RepID=A0A224YEZ3_9ACAR